MIQAKDKRMIGIEARKSISKNAKKQTRQENHLQAEQLTRIGLMFDLMAPSFINKTTNSKLSQKDGARFSSFDSSLYQVLNMDLTSYQTLKQLIIENKSLVKESQSAYFLSKQSQKLINFIDGWKKLQKNEYFEQNHLIEQSFVERRTSKQNKKLEKQEQIQNHSISHEEEIQLMSKGEPFQKKREVKKLSQKPALIIEQDQSQQQGYLIQKQDSEESDDSIQIQVEMQSENITNENNINSSNINVIEKEKNIESQKVRKKEIQKNQPQLTDQNYSLSATSKNATNKVIHLYSNYNPQTIQQQNPHPNQHEEFTNEDIKELNEIVRPEYQKTEISFSSSSQLTNSRQSQNIFLELVTYQANPPLGKKKTVPLLKKGKSSLGYNQLIQANKLASQSRVDERNEQVYLSYSENKQIVEKGFISEDTDANSRLTMLTNKQGMKKSSESSKQFQGRGSLSPKVQNNKKKVMIKRGSTNLGQNKKESTVNSKDQGQIKLSNDNQCAQREEKRMQIQLKELQEELMNRKTKQSSTIPKQPQSPKSIIIPSAQQQKTSAEYQFMKPIPKENKTLKLIKKSSSSISLSNQDKKRQSLPLSHYPLTNINISKKTQINMQKNSVVLEEEPWECDELELEEELKALDQKIMGRKSMITAKQHLGLENKQSQDTNYPNHQKQMFSYIPTRHRRSNTLSNHLIDKKNFYQDNIDNDHLFEENHDLFRDENHKEVSQCMNQPKVVRLSLNTLVNNHLGRKSRESRDSVKNNLVNERKSLRKDFSANNLKKEPSCKSILLYEEAQKRGISPSKSSKSFKNHNKRHISPIKQYTPSNNELKTFQNNHTPKEQNTNFLRSNYHNEPFYQNLTPTSKQYSSRTLSEMMDSEYHRGQKYMNGREFIMVNHNLDGGFYQNNDLMRKGWEEKMILNQTDYLKNDASTFSNCQRYFEHYQGNGMEESNAQKTNFLSQEILPTKKWNLNPIKPTKQSQKNKFVLLSDQLGD